MEQLKRAMTKPYPKSVQLGRSTITSKEFREWNDTEGSLQTACEEYLDFFPNIAVVRIPNQAYRAIFANAGVSQNIKGMISKWLKGVPDLILIKPSAVIGETEYMDNVCLCIELKVKGGKLTQGQKSFAKQANVIECRSFEHFKVLIDEFTKG